MDALVSASSIRLIRKTICVSIIASLLVTQQGFFVFAQVIGGVGKGGKVYTGAGSKVGGFGAGPANGGAGTNVLKIELQSIGIKSSLPSASGLIRPSVSQAAVGTPAEIPGLSAPVAVEVIQTNVSRPPAESAETLLASSLSQESGTTESATPSSSKSQLAGFGRKILSAAKSSKSNLMERLSRRFFDGNTRSGVDLAVEGRTLSGTEGGAKNSGLKSAKGERGPPTPPGPPSPRSRDDSSSKKIKAYLTRHGSDPIATDIGSLEEALAADPAYAASLNEVGRVRIVISKTNPHGGLTEKDIDGIRRALESYGITAKVDVENIPIDWKRKAKQAQARKSGEATGLDMNKRRGVLSRYLPAPLREAVYLLRTLVASFTAPTWPEVIGGIVSKGPPVVLGFIVFSNIFLPAFPYAFATAIGFSLLLNVFHGIWINTWANFQNNIGRQRGIQYQTFFNLGYVQLTSAIFRIITWAVIAGTIAPWSLQYWRDMGLIVLIGTFCGTLGYQGLNGLYDKGRVPRLGRSFIQQGRDLFMTLGGVFFGANSMIAFWALFGTQQILDLAIYAVSRRAQKRPIVYLADASIASSDEFQTMYPVKPGPEAEPLKQALDALINNPLFKPIVFVVKKLWSLLRPKSNAKTDEGK